MFPSLVLALISSAGPAHALDLTVSFGRPGGQQDTVTTHDLEPGVMRTVVLDDGGDLWAIDVTLDEGGGELATLVGTASLVNTDDITSPPRPFTVRTAYGTPGTARVSGYDALPRAVELTVQDPSAGRGLVECEILVAPTVDDFADALQGFVDDGLSVRTGVGPFRQGEGVYDAHWICGW